MVTVNPASIFSMMVAAFSFPVMVLTVLPGSCAEVVSGLQGFSYLPDAEVVKVMLIAVSDFEG